MIKLEALCAYVRTRDFGLCYSRARALWISCKVGYSRTGYWVAIQISDGEKRVRTCAPMHVPCQLSRRR
jgi:hypothetical protein